MREWFDVVAPTMAQDSVRPGFAGAWRTLGVGGLEQQLDGYLLRRAEQHDAEAHAEAFVARMPWLTTAQREEVIRLYVQDRITYSTAALRRVAERCHDLRAEYSARYTHLRNRLLRAATASLLGAATLWVLVVALAMGR